MTNTKEILLNSKEVAQLLHNTGLVTLAERFTPAS